MREPRLGCLGFSGYKSGAHGGRSRRPRRTDVCGRRTETCSPMIDGHSQLCAYSVRAHDKARARRGDRDARDVLRDDDDDDDATRC